MTSYAPKVVKIESIGVGVSDETNVNLALTETQYMVVGEFQKPFDNGPNSNAYNMIVDNEGVAIRSSLLDRSKTKNEYAFYVDGDVYVTGRLLAGKIMCNVAYNPALGGDGFWSQTLEDADNIYYNNKVTLGNQFQATSNTYTFNISRAADFTIDHAQFAIQNTQLSQFRTGILGYASNSPAIINTPPTTKLEFHAGRDDAYFRKTYLNRSNLRTVYDEFLNQNVTVLDSIEYGDTPVYATSNDAPHLQIDTNGLVGIHTSVNPTISYKLRVRNPAAPNTMMYSATSNPADLHVEGVTYSRDILLWDNETSNVKHLDELYIRRLGATIPTAQIEPGVFASGHFTFPDSLSVAGPAVPGHEFTVNGNTYVAEDLDIGGTTTMNQLITNDAILLDIASFCNDVYVNRDMIVNQSVRVRGQIMVEVLSNVVGTQSNYMWQMINFSPAQPSYSNINLIGQGIATPGRLGVGINPYQDEVNHQLSIYKRDPYSRIFNNMFELEISDRTSTQYKKTAFIGHPEVLLSQNRYNDGSIVFATPSATDHYYAGVYDYFPQNFYFYPGADVSPTAPLILRDSNIPTLNIHTSQRVGIKTYDPKSELDVRGTIKFSNKLQRYNPETDTTFDIGLWETKTVANPLVGGPATFQGLQYSNQDAPYIGVHTLPDIRYGMNIAGKTKLDAIYTADNRKAMLFLDSQDPYTITDYTAPATPFGLFTYGRVGIGIKEPVSTLDLKDNYQSVNGTQMRLIQGDTSISPTMSIKFQGIQEPWTMQMNDQTRRFEIGRSQDSTDTASRAMIMRYNNDLMHYQVVIGSNIKVLTSGASYSNPNPNATLTVGGDLSVMGDVNITGGFKINSQNAYGGVMPPTLPVFEEDDVYIGGGHIVLKPHPDKSLLIGDPSFMSVTTADNTSMLRLYQPNNANPVLATLRSAGNQAFIKLVAGNGEGDKVLKFGVLDPDNLSTGKASFAFLDNFNKAYMSFTQVTDVMDRFVGFNIYNPDAMLHVGTQGYGSNMFRMTKQVSDSDTSAACPEMEFQKTYPLKSPAQWTVRGPDASFQQKLSILYSDSTTPKNELYTFSSNGCFGVGNTQPEFSLDIRSTGKQGALRLWNTGMESAPQLMFQSGNPTYGNDSAVDYRMMTSNSEFTFDMQDVEDYNLLLNVASNGNMGFRTHAREDATFTFAGKMNVTEAILLNGSPLFLAEGQTYEEGIMIRSKNVFLIPKPPYGGGVVVNSSNTTGNLFHLYSGINCNMMVFDSDYEESQLHFRIRENQMITSKFNMYRMGMSLDSFFLEYYRDCSNQPFVDSGRSNYDPVFRFKPSERINTTSNVFDMTLQGQYYSIADDAGLRMISHGKECSIEANNGNMYILPTINCNIGIGTTTANARVQITASTDSDTPVLLVQQSNIYDGGNILELHNDSGKVANVTRYGDMFLYDGHTYLSSGTEFRPSYSFNNYPSTGMYLPMYHTIAFSTWGTERMRISSFGSINMGDKVHPRALLHLEQQAYVLLHVHQKETLCDAVQVVTDSASNAFFINGNGNVGIGTSQAQHTLHVECGQDGSVGIGGHLLPTSNIEYNLGSADARWKDIYLSGSTIDLGGSLIQRDPDGSVRFNDATGLKRVVMKELQLGSEIFNDSNIVIIKGNKNTGVSFTLINPLTNTSNTITPITTSGALDTAVSIGVSTPRATLHIASCNLPTLIVEQRGTCNIAEFYGANDYTRPAVYMNYLGNLGLGTCNVPYPINISTNSTTTGINVVQSGTGDIAQWSSGTGRKIVFDRSANVGINTSIATHPLHVVGTQKFDGRSYFTSNVYMATNLEIQGNAVTHGDAITDSDIRLKTDLAKIDNALDKVSTLTGYTFTRISDQKRSTGLIAQDVMEVLPEAVCTEGAHLGLAYGNMMGLIIEAIKDLKNEVNSIKKHLNI